jgi:hypothetical protein
LDRYGRVVNWHFYPNRPEWPTPVRRTISGGAARRRPPTSSSYSPTGFDQQRVSLRSVTREMSSVASCPRCSVLLLPPSLAGVRHWSPPSSSLRLRPRWRRRTIACVGPPDSVEPETVSAAPGSSIFNSGCCTGTFLLLLPAE